MIGLIGSIFTGPILKGLADALMGPLESAFRDYMNAKITKEQLAEKLQEALIAGLTQVETQLYDSITKTYAAFMQAAAQSKTMQRVWAAVAISELLVLLWHQVGIPALVTFGYVKTYASSGATVDWAYALLALCLGAPAIASRIGPAASWTADNLSKIIKR